MTAEHRIAVLRVLRLEFTVGWPDLLSMLFLGQPMWLWLLFVALVVPLPAFDLDELHGHEGRQLRYRHAGVPPQ